ncbi:MAG: cation:proton antiporter domain-containing protein [Gammaproteobacteria bacterium]
MTNQALHVTTLTLLLFSAAILAYAAVSRRSAADWVTPAMAFVAVGLLAGPAGLALVVIPLRHEHLELLAELALVLVLFADASRINLSLLRHEHSSPLRLLGLGIPLSIALGTGAALLIFDGLGLWSAVLLAALLAPTDAALSQPMLTMREVPARIRQAINIESGLNDGIVVPIVLVLIPMAEGVSSLHEFGVVTAGLQLVVGAVVGVAVGIGGSFLLDREIRAHWASGAFQRLSVVAVALAAFAAASLLGGSGLLAAFCAGLTAAMRSHSVAERVQDSAETEGLLLALLTFMFFGTVLLPPTLERLSVPIVAYALLSLTVVRFGAVLAALAGTRMQWSTIAFIGWFGPRGMASILLLLTVFETSSIRSLELLLDCVVTTVCFSVFAHGLSAVPIARWYSGAALRLKDRRPGAPEHASVFEFPWRNR